MKHSILKSWRTSICGIVCLGIGFAAMAMTYIPHQTLYFNAVYVWRPFYGLLAAGFIGLHARDHKAKD